MSKRNINDFQLTITKIDQRDQANGAWVIGSVNGKYKINALVFHEHAECESYELGKSKISKLWIQDTANQKVHFNFDRGLDMPATNAEVELIVDFLCAGLADLALRR